MSLPWGRERLHSATRAVKSSFRLAKALSRSSVQSWSAGSCSTVVPMEGIYPVCRWFRHYVNGSMIATSIGGTTMDIRPYRIDPATALQSIEAGEAVVLDLTSPLIGTAVRGRIPGARWVSPRDFLDNRHAADPVRE